MRAYLVLIVALVVSGCSTVACPMPEEKTYCYDTMPKTAPPSERLKCLLIERQERILVEIELRDSILSCVRLSN